MEFRYRSAVTEPTELATIQVMQDSSSCLNHFDPIPWQCVIGGMMFIRERVDGIILEVIRVGELIHVNAVHPESGRVIHTTELSDQEAELLAADLDAVIEKRFEQASGRVNRR